MLHGPQGGSGGTAAGDDGTGGRKRSGSRHSRSRSNSFRGTD
jgi:hypothetical protein